ncbi:hypothetical protein ACKWTF_006056 [Chironomus riparius]
MHFTLPQAIVQTDRKRLHHNDSRSAATTTREYNSILQTNHNKSFNKEICDDKLIIPFRFLFFSFILIVDRCKTFKIHHKNLHHSVLFKLLNTKKTIYQSSSLRKVYFEDGRDKK